MSSYLKTIVLFLVLLGFGSVFWIFFSRILDILIFTVALLLIILNRGMFSIKMLLLCAIVSIFFIVHNISTHTVFTPYLAIILRIMILLLVISGFKNDYHDIKIHLIKAINIIVFLSCVNIVLVILIQNWFYEIIDVDTEYRVNTLFYLFNYLDHGIRDVSETNFMRNQGLYWEPGILQAPMNILIYYLLIEKDYNIGKAKWPIFVVLSTFSTTGIILLAFILLYKLSKMIISHKGSVKVFVTALLIIIFIPFFIGEIRNKFSGDDKWSSYARIYDAFVGMRVSIRHFWTGIGIMSDSDKYIDEINNEAVTMAGGIRVNLQHRGTSNGIITWFVNFGIPLGFILILFLYKQKIFSHKNIFFIIIFFILCSEPVSTTYFSMLLLLSALPVKNKYYYCREVINA